MSLLVAAGCQQPELGAVPLPTEGKIQYRTHRSIFTNGSLSLLHVIVNGILLAPQPFALLQVACRSSEADIREKVVKLGEGQKSASNLSLVQLFRPWGLSAVCGLGSLITAFNTSSNLG